ncbi:MAG: DMT family transporter [bacterium]|nr:DMT family transporter [bacterium]
MNPPFPYFGEALSLLAAVFWATAIIFFKKSGDTVHPAALNLFKNSLAFVLFIPTAYLFGETLFRDAPLSHYALLFLSGVIGLGIGDVLFLKSLNLLGAGLTAIVSCLWAPFIAGMSIVFLHEHLSVLQIIGIMLVAVAVLVATLRTKSDISRHDLAWGLFWGVLALVSMAVGIVMIKPLLNISPLLWVTEVRLAGALTVLIVGLLFYPKRRAILSTLAIKKGWGYTITGSFIGAYLAMFTWLAGMKYALASVASAINQISTLITFILAFIILREPLTARRVAGIILAFVGAALVSFG